MALSFPGTKRPSRKANRSLFRNLRRSFLEPLEDRRMLAVIDLATDLNGSFPGDTAIYDRTDLGASGSGNIDSFVRVQNTGVEEGFNSSFRPTQMNEDSTLTFNHDLQLAAVQIGRAHV